MLMFVVVVARRMAVELLSAVPPVIVFSRWTLNRFTLALPLVFDDWQAALSDACLGIVRNAVGVSFGDVWVSEIKGRLGRTGLRSIAAPPRTRCYVLLGFIGLSLICHGLVKVCRGLSKFLERDCEGVCVAVSLYNRIDRFCQLEGLPLSGFHDLRNKQYLAYNTLSDENSSYQLSF